MTRQRQRFDLWRSRLCLAPIFLILLSSLASCTQSSSEEADIRIGAIAPLSGELFKSSGEGTVNGAKLAIAEINQAGGLKVGQHQHPIVLSVKDDKDEPDEAVKAARELNQEGVVAIVGPPLSRNAIPVADLVETLRIPTISPTSTNPKTTAGKQYVFRVAFVDDFQGQVMAQFARKELKIQKAAVLYDVASAYNRGLAEYFKQQFESAGGEVVAFETYTTGERDFTEQLKRIQDNQAQAIFLPNYPPEIILQVNQARKLGIKATFIGGDSWGDLNLSDRPELNGAFYSTLWSADANNERSQAFIQAYRQAYNQIPDDSAAMTYDALGLIFQAIQTQGKVDSESIRNGLANIQHYEGVSGRLEYQGTGDPIKSAVILQIQAGKPVFYKQVNP